jgi:N-acetylmuramoyl-L-alanine amidase
MKTIYLEAGHHLSDPGAVTQTPDGQLTEASLTTALRNLVAVKLNELAAIQNKAVLVVTDSDAMNLSQTIVHAGRQTKACDIVCSIHFNAGPPAASGTETFIAFPASEAEQLLAQRLQKAMCTALQLPNRGVKTELQSARRRLGILHHPAQNVLLEVCFITNPTDLSTYLQKQDLVAEAIAKSLLMSI